MSLYFVKGILYCLFLGYSFFAGRKGGSPPELPSYTSQMNMIKFVFPVKALKPQWIVHSIVPYHDTLCSEAA
ncbi:hypothetical protein ACQWU4_04165 [Chryseobacterium sp. MIQD13]|uniref:hypothetical protein n=1 Tax=Chryseobacterium sp. MIQD13 TaxID=3422310 RepID=UPI003D2AD2E8